MDFVGDADEQAVLDDPRKLGESGGQPSGIVDRAEITVEHEVAVVGDDRAVLALGPPECRVATETLDRAGDGRPSGREDFEWHWVIEHGCVFRRVDDDEEAVGGGVDDLLAGVGRAAAFHEVAVGDLVGPVDGDIDRDVVEIGQRDAGLAGQFARLEGGRNAGHVQPRVDGLADSQDRVCRCGSGPQSHDHPVFDRLGGRLPGRALRRVGASLFHVQSIWRGGQNVCSPGFEPTVFVAGTPITAMAQFASVLIYDGECPYCSVAATALERVDDLGAISWYDGAAQAFLEAQFDATPFAMVLVDAESATVYAGRAAAEELTYRAGMPDLVGSLVRDNYDTIARVVGLASARGRDPADVHEQYSLTDAGSELFQSLAASAVDRDVRDSSASTA